MKISLRHFIPTALLWLPLAAYSAIGPISMRVEQVSKSDNEKNEKTQHRSLKVTLTNSSPEDKPSLIVKYWIFGKEVEDKDIVVLDKGERPGSVNKHATGIVETGSVSARSTEDHYDKKAKKKIEASGEKMAGYAVQVFDGPTMVAEAYEPDAMKEQIGKAKVKPPAAAPDKKKKK